MNKTSKQNQDQDDQDDIREAIAVFKVAKRMYDAGTSLERIEEVLGLDFSKSPIKL